MHLIQWALILFYLQVEAYDELIGEIRNLLLAIIMLLTLQVLMDSLRHIPWPHIFGQAASGPAALGQTGGPNIQPVQEMDNGQAALSQTGGPNIQPVQEMGNEQAELGQSGGPNIQPVQEMGTGGPNLQPVQEMGTGGPNLQPVQEMSNGQAAHGQSNGQIPQARQKVGNAEDMTPLSIEEMHGPADSGAVENDDN